MYGERHTTALEAMTRPGFLLSAWPWRGLVYLLGTGALAVAVTGALLGISSLWILAVDAVWGPGPIPYGVAAVAALLGALLVVGLAPWATTPLAALERRRLRLVDPRGITVPARPGYWTKSAWLRVLYIPVSLVTGVLCGIVLAVILLLLGVALGPLLVANSAEPVALLLGDVETVPQALLYSLGALVSLAVVGYLATLVAAGHAAVARLMLDSAGGLRAELVEVARSRARLVDAFQAERRRIERDLHDGAQERLVSLTLQLGLARLDIPMDSPAYQPVARAHEQAKSLMEHLREVVRDINPRVLTDRGLPDALGELADRVAMPVTVNTALSGRYPAHLEATVYFVAAEALTNASKHSGASAVSVKVAEVDGLLVVEVVDDGQGGAQPDGSGLTGLADRVAVSQGRLLLASPAGGPTRLRVELPVPVNAP